MLSNNRKSPKDRLSFNCYRYFRNVKSKNHIALILIILLLTLTESRVSAQAYNFQELSIHQGLPQSQAYAIMFDSTQHAWIGTQGGGLCRYDGFEFNYITKRDSLISNRVYSLEQIDNHIWVGQKGGVSVFDLNGEFILNYRLSSPTVVVNDIVVYKSKTYFATDIGLMVLEKDEIEQYDKNVTISNQTIYSFFETKNGLWLCANQGLLSLEKPLSKINKAKGLSKDQVQCALEYGNYWMIGTYGGGLNVYSPNDGILKANSFEVLNDYIILSLFESKTGDLWIGTLNHGVFVFSQKDGLLKNYQSSNGLSNNHVRVVIADMWDNIWIGTSGGGISIFQNSPFVEYNSTSGMNGNYVYSVLKSDNNAVWTGTEGAGVVRVNDTSAVTFDEEYGFFSEKVKAIYQDYSGDIWIGTEGKGLGIFSQYDGKDTIYTFGNKDGMTSEWVKCFAQENRSAPLYIGTGGGGVMQVSKSWEFPVKVKFLKVKPENGNFPARISSLNFIDGQLWYTSSESEYGYLIDDKIVSMNSGSTTFRNCVGYHNNRWLGSTDNGLLKLTLNGDSIVSENWIGVNNGLSSNNIYQLILKDNELWVGTEKGLDQLILDSIGNIMSIEHFGYEEGFEGVETNINATHLDKQGNLWFGTVEGLFLYQGGEVNYNQRKPPVILFSDFSIFYESIENTDYADFYSNGVFKKELLLPYDLNHIGFSFKAIHYTYAKNIRYRWMLSGADNNWTPPSKITTATYSNLGPGSYTFQVKASIDDNWDVKPIVLSFSIDQPYYEKSWFKAIYYSTISLLLIALVLLFVFRIRKKNRLLHEKYEMEKNLIELEQKALRLQMNPHFIFNALTSIHNLIILNDSDKARYALSKFSKLMRDVLENSRERFISIDDEIKTLENYVQLEKLTSKIDVQLIIKIDDNIDSAEDILPPLMIQPFVENALIHGLKTLKIQGVIEVGFKLLNDNLLECYIQDNGVGRLRAAQMTAQKENYHKSTALTVTQERLANLNKDVSFTPFEILDLSKKDGSPAGTKVIMRLAI